eukprot:CAMPEP_0198281384 /NCGR_PEP_ID=MMETSP1449-20131203/1347_1 /TAXON_ID=420275 /ORGANISM="Attheya septentrionalis, Strain CCMP2084" /LENGTH=343 /DNA_ID=CAMNT_0043977149 /DNA_START=129 /DNA_END=1160 /DNA_ORIENTATION=+
MKLRSRQWNPLKKVQNTVDLLGEQGGISRSQQEPCESHRKRRRGGCPFWLGSLMFFVAAASTSKLLHGPTRPVPAPSTSAKVPLLGRIKQISVLGERNSGTRWTYEHLVDCFNHSIPVRRRLTRYKHWFQFESPDMYPSETLVIAQFRNPYEWVEAMRRVPHHASEHIQLDWRRFVTKPWTMPRLDRDLEFLRAFNSTKDKVCQENFTALEILSCIRKPFPPDHFRNKTIRFSEHQPIYELNHDGSGHPYQNILEMRADKIRNFVSIRKFDGIFDVWTVQYEFLLRLGTAVLVEKIENATGIKAQCETFEPQKREQRRLGRDFVNYMVEHADWEAETLIGFYP